MPAKVGHSAANWTDCRSTAAHFWRKMALPSDTSLFHKPPRVTLNSFLNAKPLRQRTQYSVHGAGFLAALNHYVWHDPSSSHLESSNGPKGNVIRDTATSPYAMTAQLVRGRDQGPVLRLQARHGIASFDTRRLASPLASFYSRLVECKGVGILKTFVDGPYLWIVSRVHLERNATRFGTR